MLGLMSGIQAALGLAGGAVGMWQHNKYANLLEDQNLTMPDAMGKAESIYGGLASQGLQGYDTIQQNIESRMPSTINLAKETVDSPSALIDLLAKTNAESAAQTRQLGVQDAQAKSYNQNVLGDFLSRAKAPMEMQLQQFEIQKKLDAERERMLGWSELFGSAVGAGNIGMQYFGNLANQDYMKKMMDFIVNGGGGRDIEIIPEKIIPKSSNLPKPNFELPKPTEIQYRNTWNGFNPNSFYQGGNNIYNDTGTLQDYIQNNILGGYGN